MFIVFIGWRGGEDRTRGRQGMTRYLYFCPSMSVFPPATWEMMLSWEIFRILMNSSIFTDNQFRWERIKVIELHKEGVACIICHAVCSDVQDLLDEIQYLIFSYFEYFLHYFNCL